MFELFHSEQVMIYSWLCHRQTFSQLVKDVWELLSVHSLVCSCLRDSFDRVKTGGITTHDLYVRISSLTSFLLDTTTSSPSSSTKPQPSTLAVLSKSSAANSFSHFFLLILSTGASLQYAVAIEARYCNRIKQRIVYDHQVIIKLALNYLNNRSSCIPQASSSPPSWVSWAFSKQRSATQPAQPLPPPSHLRARLRSPSLCRLHPPRSYQWERHPAPSSPRPVLRPPMTRCLKFPRISGNIMGGKSPPPPSLPLPEKK